MINVEIQNDFFTDDEQEKLKDLFNSSADEDFSTSINKITLAALTEYKEMLLGKGLPTRADEIKQHRLFHIIKHFFEGVLPNESQVSSMFQLTESESKALIRNVRTRFRYQLEAEIMSTLQKTVENAIFDEDEYHVVIKSDNVIEELNRLISEKAPQLDPVTKIRGSARKYKVSEDTFNLLTEHLCENYKSPFVDRNNE